MIVVVSLFWDYLSPFSWYLGPILQIIGLLCLWATRFTGRYYEKWGERYYLFSAIARPVGIIFITWAWLEMFSVNPDVPPKFAICFPILPVSALLIFVLTLANGFLRGFLGALAIVTVVFTFVFFFLFGGSFVGWPFIGLPAFFLLLLWEIAAILKLGLRRSFLYVRMDDSLITDGIYAHHRHPQLIAAILMIFFAIDTLSKNYNDTIKRFQAMNFLILAVFIAFIIWSEEKDLMKRFGGQYADYRKAAPLFSRKTPDKKFRFVYKLLLTLASFAFSFPLLIAMGNGNGYLYAIAESSYRIEDSEAKVNLASICTASLGYFAELENWGMTFDVIGWAPEGKIKHAYFLNSCDLVLPSSNGFKDCPDALKEYFKQHPFNKEEGFHAAAVFMPTLTNSGHLMKIWVIDKNKIPTLLLKTEVSDAYLPMSRKSRDIFRRRGSSE